MARHPRQLSGSGIHHVVWRGINRDALFIDDADHEQFLACLATVRALSGCTVLAYCLMSNHIHLLIQVAGEPLDEVMKRLGVRYAGWFNRKYGRVGHLFQDRFWSRPVETDAYFRTALRYVWNNPVEAGIVSRPEEYAWGSRRFLDCPDGGVVDHQQLRRLVDLELLNEVVDEAPSVRPGRPSRYNDGEARALLRRACGVDGPDGFRELSASDRRRTISLLRTQSVSYDQIARLTGLSATTIRRIQAAGAAAA